MRNTILYILTFAFFFSCDSLTKEVDFEDDQYPISIVINSFPSNNNSVNEISLTESRGILDAESEFEILNNANIRLYENDNLVEQTNTINSNNRYELEHDFLQNSEYRIEVSHANFEDVSSSTIIPRQVNNIQAQGMWDQSRARINIQFEDNLETEFYQLFLVSQENLVGWETSSQYFDIDPFEGEQYFYDDALFSHVAFLNSTADLDIETTFPIDTSDVKVLIYSCSEDYFNYYKSRNAWEDNEFSGPFSQPVQIYTNVDRGLGIFAGYSVSEVHVNF